MTSGPDLAAAPQLALLDDGCCPAPAGESEESEPAQEWWRDPGLRLPALSGVLLAAGLAVSRLEPGWLGRVLLIGALLAGAATFAPAAVRRLARGRVGVGLLMTIAAVGAVLLGQVAEAAALAFLFSIAEALEDRAMDRARHGLRGLLELVPPTARTIRDGHEATIPAADLRVGDVLLVGPGQRVATDGIVLAGRSSVDTSAVTGESIPVTVAQGDPVPAGSVNGSGALRVRATADGADNSLTQIVALVEAAQARKGQRARLADRVARPLVPGILVVAAAVALAGLLTDDPGMWAQRALVVLVAASPCALAIAVPVTVIAAIGAASRFGVIIKSGAAFEDLGAIGTVAFDKTGTLTRNQPQVVAVHATPGSTPDQVLDQAAALEAASSHPLARAIVTAAGTHPTARDVVEHPGLGLTGTIERSPVAVGSPRWIRPGDLADQVTDMTGQGMTAVLVAVDDKPVGAIGIRDELRPEAASTVRLLTEAGIDVLMLTGDNPATANALAQQAGIRAVSAEQSPADKAATVAALASRAPTAMVGDGTNDAPALAAATVGIAMGLTGTAAAVESADVAFTGTDLQQIPHALAHARRGRRIMTANIALALAIIAVLVPAAITGALSLAAVVLIHEAAEILVIGNGLRAATTRTP